MPALCAFAVSSAQCSVSPSSALMSWLPGLPLLPGSGHAPAPGHSISCGLAPHSLHSSFCLHLQEQLRSGQGRFLWVPSSQHEVCAAWVTVNVSEQWESEAFVTGWRVLGQSRVPADVVAPVGYLKDGESVSLQTPERNAFTVARPCLGSDVRKCFSPHFHSLPSPALLLLRTGVRWGGEGGCGVECRHSPALQGKHPRGAR